MGQLNGLWLSAKSASYTREIEVKGEKGRGGQSSKITTFDNDGSKRRDEQLGFVEWYYLFGP